MTQRLVVASCAQIALPGIAVRCATFCARLLSHVVGTVPNFRSKVGTRHTPCLFGLAEVPSLQERKWEECYIPRDHDATMTSSPDLSKLDDGLARLVGTPLYGSSELIPVAVRAFPDALDAVVLLVQQHAGRVRHVLRPLNAVVAWIPLGKVEELTAEHAISSIEIDQVMHIA